MIAHLQEHQRGEFAADIRQVEDVEAGADPSATTGSDPVYTPTSRMKTTAKTRFECQNIEL